MHTRFSARGALTAGIGNRHAADIAPVVARMTQLMEKIGRGLSAGAHSTCGRDSSRSAGRSVIRTDGGCRVMLRHGDQDQCFRIGRNGRIRGDPAV